MPSTRREPNQKPETQAKKPGTSVRQPFLTEDAEVAFHHFRSIVAQTPEDDLDPWTGDALIVVYKAGVEIWGRRKVDAHIPALMSRAAATPPGEPQVPRAARQSPLPRRRARRRPRPRRPRSRSTPDVPPATPRPVLR
ncbi:hypothetical protein [Sorangium sp. So ce128]|uniref:hypothetical protein n=1 Tax=Sorangium sp. So ce128 TaxID=3133281 RepID=UPI003F6216E7